jgi:hypothetical protein
MCDHCEYFTEYLDGVNFRIAPLEAKLEAIDAIPASPIDDLKSTFRQKIAKELEPLHNLKASILAKIICCDCEPNASFSSAQLSLLNKFAETQSITGFKPDAIAECDEFFDVLSVLPLNTPGELVARVVEKYVRL